MFTCAELMRKHAMDVTDVRIAVAHRLGHGLLVKAARMNFLDSREQGDIAHVLGTSRSNVSRMMAAARAQGIAEIRIQDPEGRDEDLEHVLRERFGISQARVAAFHPCTDARAAVAELAEGWLDDSLQDGHVVGLSW